MKREAPATLSSPSQVTPPADVRLPLSRFEFITLAALLTCLTALSIDIMLPVLPQLAAGLGVEDANHRQWVVTSYLIGLVVGQLFVGTLSDRHGRLPVLFGGLALFIIGAGIAGAAQSFEWLLLARMVQGIGGAAPRIVVVAVVRDLFEGRQMARIMSLVMTTFIMVPIFAPSLGQLLAIFGGWRTPIFALSVAGIAAFIWAWLRLPETSPRHSAAAERHSDGSVAEPVTFREAFTAVLQSRVTVGYVAANGFMFACLMSYILSSQQIFVDVYHVGTLFPVVFGGIAFGMAIAGVINARVVVRLGMRHVAHRAIGVFVVLAVAMLAVSLSYDGRPPLIVLWGGLWLQFLCFGLIVSNFNALALEPLGRVAGTASSVMGSYTTLSGAVFGTLIGQTFNMTALPLNVGFVVFSGLALIIVLITERGLPRRRDASA